MKRFLICCFLAIGLTSCRSLGKPSAITLLEEIPFQTDQNDQAFIDQLTSNVWLIDNGTKAIFFNQHGESVQSYGIDDKGLIDFIYGSKDNRSYDEDKARTSAFGVGLINVPQKLSSVEGGIVSQLKVGKLVFVGFYPMTEIGQQTAFAVDPDETEMLKAVLDLPNFDNNSVAVPEIFTGLLFNNAPEKLKEALSNSAGKLFSIDKINEQDTWTRSNLAVPKTTKDALAIEKIRRQVEENLSKDLSESVSNALEGTAEDAMN